MKKAICDRNSIGHILFLAFVAMAISVSCTHTMQEAPEPLQYPKNPKIDQTMQAFVNKGELSGAVTLVGNETQILYLSAVGDRDLEKPLPMRTDTIFWIASMTKLMTSTAVMMLQEQGKISLDDQVSKYIPEFAGLKTPSGKGANPTLRMLITHTSGLQEAPDELMHRAHTLAELIPSYLDRPTKFEPGTKWDYCQSGINTLGRIIEIVSGESYAGFMQQRIFDPMGLKDTTFYPTPEQVKRLAISYSLKNGKLIPTKISRIPGPVGDRSHYAAANGGLFSTAGDYYRFAKMLLDGGTLDGRRYLSADSIRELTSIQTGNLKAGFIPGSAWGLGFGMVRLPTGITEKLSAGTFGHGGMYGTQAWIDPVKRRIYILLIQRADLVNSDASDFRRYFQRAAVQ
jgi:CubicO group peptidase (beta-lactamase class C family)